MSISRQERRRRAADLVKRGQQIVRDGLAPRHPIEDVVALSLLLRGHIARDARGASAAAALADGILDRSLARHGAAERLACRKGCAYCCHSYVSILAPEAFLIAERMRTAGTVDKDAAIRRAAARLAIAAQTPAPGAARAACAFLDESLCSIYDVRPLACRNLVSRQVEPCIAAYQGKDVEIPVPEPHVRIGQACKLAFVAALRSLRLEDAAYELGEAVRIVTATADAERRWLAGENVLAAAKPDTYRPAQVEQMIERLAAEIGALAPR
jgi:hypothetical protein